MKTVQKPPKKLTTSRINARRGRFLAACAIILAILIKSLISGNFGSIGPDSDDVMRLVQIKDYLAGQSWFHTDQYRMGLAGGTDMHWSRLPDIPIILLTHIFDIFMPQEQALMWAFTIWPPLSAGLLIYACLVGAKFWGGQKTQFFTLVLLAIYLFSFYRFAPGAIDHHNLQLGFLGLSGAFALDPKLRFRSYFISGFALAVSIAIGAEIYIFAAVICAYVALHWAYHGKLASAATQGFGLGFSATLILVFLVTVAPSEYGLIYCDALSLTTVTLGALGGLGLAGLAKISPVIGLGKSAGHRLFGLIILGVLCGLVLLIQAPQCLVNPLDELSPEVIDLWLNKVSEARPITHATIDKTTTLPYMIAAPIVAIIILISDIFKNLSARKTSAAAATPLQETSVKILPLGLLIVTLGLTFYQMRFYPFAYVFAVVPLAAWISRIYTESKLKNPASVIYLMALIVSVPSAWATPGLLMKDSDGINSEGVKEANPTELAKCKSDNVLNALKGLPTGTILSNSDMSGFILNNTQHRTVSGNYHRNWKGIEVEIQVAVSDPIQAKGILMSTDIDYIYHCETSIETSIYADYNEEGLTANISKGKIADYLERVSPAELEDGGVTIFKIKR